MAKRIMSKHIMSRFLGNPLLIVFCTAIFTAVFTRTSTQASIPGNQTICHKVAQVLISSKSSDVGKVLCKERPFSLAVEAVATCIVTGKRIPVTSTKDLELCESSSPVVSPCAPDNPNATSFCIIGRSTQEDKNRPNLIEPYGAVLQAHDVKVSWQGVPGADFYRVVIDADRTHTKTNTTNTAIQIPLKEGNLAIIVQAIKGKNVVGSSTNTYDVLSEVKSDLIEKKLSQIDKFVATNSEKTIVKLSFLTLNDLTNDAILLLRNQLNVRRTTQISRFLAEYYLQAGAYYKSQEQYRETIDMAQKNNDRVELTKAENGYKIVSLILESGLKPRS